MNARQFLESLTATGILPAAELTGTTQSLSAQQLAADADTVARELVRQNKLTKYQAANIYQGRAKALVFGEYVVLDKLGAGGMGQVFKAQHRRMKRIVALKILPPKATNSEAAVKRFYQEVEMAARLHHPNIVTAYDASESHGLHYLVMEYVDGRDFSSYLSKHGPLSVEQAMNCVLQAAQALEYAHGLGIIHRDIKPSNLLVDRKGTVKVLDMGLARIDSAAEQQPAEGDGLTMAGELLGTIDYMSPEQARDSRHADHRSDIYSLGCTLHRLLINEPPYPADTVVKKLLAHREQPIPSLRARRPEVPSKLDALLEQMLAKDAAARPQSMTEVIAALKALLAGKSDEESSVSVLDDLPRSAELESFLNNPSTASAPRLSGSSASGLGGAAAVGGEPSVRRRKQPVKPATPLPMPMIAAAGGALVLVLALVAWLALRKGDDEVAVAITNPEKPAAMKPAEPAKKSGEPLGHNSKAATPASQPAQPAMPVAPPVAKPEPAQPAAPVVPPAAPPAQPAAEQPKPASVAPPPVAKPLSEPVNLLKLIDPATATNDKWSFDGGVLVRHGEKRGTTLPVPFYPPEEYDLVITFDPLGKNDLGIGLVAQGRQTALWLNNYKSPGGAWLETSDDDISTARGFPPAGGDQPRTLVCAVRRKTIYATLDGAAVFSWTGDPATLALVYGLVPPDSKQLFLSGMEQSKETRISRFEIKPPGLPPPRFGPSDVLAVAELPRDVVSGTARREADELLLDNVADTNGTRVGVPVARPNEYEATLVVERVSGTPALDVGLPFGSSHAPFMVDNGGYSYASGADVTMPNRLLLFPWRLHQVKLSVRRGHFDLVVDGKPIVSAAQYVPRAEVDFAGREMLSLRAYTSSFRLSRLRLAPLDWKKLALPTGETLEKADKAVEPLLAPVQANARPEDKARVAAQLWAKSSALPGEPAERWAALRAAGQLAAESGDLALVAQVATDIEQAFDGDHRELISGFVADALKTGRTPAARAALVGGVMHELDVATAAEDFAVASAFHAAGSAVKGLPAELTREIKARGVELGFWLAEQTAYEQAAYEKGVAELKRSSSGPEANTAAGRYLALVRGSWAEAATLLQKGNDPALAAVVKAEAMPGRKPDDELALAEQWWGLSEKAATPLRWVYLERAASNYRRAAGKVGTKGKIIEQRVRSLAAQRKTSAGAFALRHPYDAVKLGERWYKIFATPVSWHVANAACESVGGSLPIVKTAADNESLTRFLASTAGKDERLACWLGCSDQDQEGDFRWLDGTPVAAAFTNWLDGQPDNAGGQEDFAAMQLVFEAGAVTTSWSDFSDQQPHPIVCVWDF